MSVPESDAVLRKSGSSFAAAFRLLPRDSRRGMTAFYAFCRDLDDAVDRAPGRDAALEGLERWSREIDRIEQGHASTPIGLEVAVAVLEFSTGVEPLRLVLEGVRRDLEPTSYATFEDLYGYCYHVASAVGIFVCAVLGARGEQARRYAEITGVAVQLTNIIRDVWEDASLGRIYLPREDMQRFAVREAEILASRPGPGFAALVRFEAARARALYRIADASVGPDMYGTLCFARALSATYRELLSAVEKSPPLPGQGKTRIPAGRRIAVLSRLGLEALMVRAMSGFGIIP